ncbi:flp/fap pilin component [Lucifera butyrica]|uniref:Flp/fap pilin component n=1 Tax=Lucifera butyrica TaxID=1351585 RepID=A0A498R1X1_9FIRM|nr:Flp family type IVb pilin [Lucifera butyrica]VBB06616.1 flp/fap pilin component [Lucifera butyrica]
MMLLEMVKMMFRNQKGQGMVEYGLILALIAVVVMGTLAAMGTTLNGMFTKISGSL